MKLYTLVPFLLSTLKVVESRSFVSFEEKRERELMCSSSISEKGVGGGKCTNPGGRCQCYIVGDPHIKTWDGTYFDYHGGCDLVFIKHPLLNVHIRSEPRYGWASTSHAAVEISGDIFELDDECDMKRNGKRISSPPSTLGGKEVVYHEYGFFGSTKNFEIIVVGGIYPQTVELECFPNQSSQGVLVHANLSPQDFSGTEGVCGSLYGLAGLICRDGCKGCINYDCIGTSYGEDWQVDPELDGTILSNPDTSECSPPLYSDSSDDRTCSNSKNRMRHLEEKRFEENRATCDEVIPEGAPDAVKDNCAFDLTTTNDTTYLEQPFYNDPVELKPDDEPRCTAVGTNCNSLFGLIPGECVYGGCDRSEYLCFAGQCCDTEAEEDCSNNEALAAQDSCMCAIEIALFPPPFNTIVSIFVQIMLFIEDLTG